MQAKYLASIILAVLAISIGVLMYTLTTNVIQEFANLLTPSQLNQMKIDVTIGSVVFMAPTQGDRYIWITVNNKSPLKVCVTKVTIIEGMEKVKVLNVTNSSEVSPPNPTIDAGDILDLILYFNWTSQQQYKIILFIKAEGQSASIEVKWEGTSPA
ncbi:hypothetical protein DRO02_06345 [archaeon]|nr:MAG: hypothetical protein DRO02_06345 [archaeon]